eukprot:Nk52_evm8s343 gene=Nk52_evmTU8s343
MTSTSISVRHTVNSFRVKELKDFLRAFYLSTSGNKNVLQNRINHNIDACRGSAKYDNMVKKIGDLHAKMLAEANRPTYSYSSQGNYSRPSNSANDPLDHITEYNDFEYKWSPYFKKVRFLMKPCKMSTERRVCFTLTPDEFGRLNVGTNGLRVKLRCRTSASPQDDMDMFPNFFNIWVGDRLVELPAKVKEGVKHIRPSHKDLTSHVRSSTTTVRFGAHSVTSASYIVAIELVQLTPISEFMNTIPRIPSLDCRQRFEKIMSRHSELIVGDTKMGLKCPISKLRIKIPARGLNCGHMQCFDVEMYLQMNERERGEKWSCPVCDKRTDAKQLVIDCYVKEILSDTDESASEVLVKNNGGWELPKIKTVNIDDCVEEKPDTPQPKKRKVVECIDLTLSDDEEEVISAPSVTSSVPGTSISSLSSSISFPNGPVGHLPTMNGPSIAVDTSDATRRELQELVGNISEPQHAATEILCSVSNGPVLSGTAHDSAAPALSSTRTPTVTLPSLSQGQTSSVSNSALGLSTTDSISQLASAANSSGGNNSAGGYGSIDAVNFGHVLAMTEDALRQDNARP